MDVSASQSSTKILRIIVFSWIVIMLTIAISSGFSVYDDMVEKEHNTFRSIRHLAGMSCALVFFSFCAAVLLKSVFSSDGFSKWSMSILVTSARICRILVLFVAITLGFLWYKKQELDLDMSLTLIVSTLFSGYGFFTLWWLKKNDLLPDSDE